MSARLRPWLLYWLAWVPIGGLYTAALAREVSSLRDAIAGGALAILVAGLMGMGIWRLSGWLPWPDRKRGRFAVIQILAALLFVTVWVGTIYGRIAIGEGWETAGPILRSDAGWTLLMGFWLFGVITGVSHVIRGEQRIREQQKAVECAEALRARAELQALRARLHPHFLFNTLHGVKSLVRRDPARAEVAIERLGDLLRSLLGRGQETDDVPLEEELAFVRKYLALEELRLGDRLRVVERVEADSLECGVPPLILQPLVENAIRHGIAPRGGGGTLRLTAQLRNGDLVVGVSDDGPGSADADFEGAPGLGLRTVRQRLEAGFGRRARLEIETAAGMGFAVTLSLPARAFVPLDGATRDGRSEIGP
jgi:anti-sigma regulatory factor (Ser/Thr protein kinase)